MENQYPVSDELTLRELILTIQDYATYFLKKWYWFVFGAGIVAGIFFYLAYAEKATYVAPLTFVMNNDKESSIGAGAILGSLGLGGGGGGGNNALKLVEMAQSRQLLGNILFDTAVVNGEEQLIANHLINYYDLRKNWVDNSNLKDFSFESGRPAIDDRTGNSVYKKLYGLLVREEDGLFSVDADDFTGIFTITTSTLEPELSIAITESIYTELKEYYISSTVSGKQHTLEQLSSRADSVKAALSLAEARLARFNDRRGRVLNASSVQGQELSREVLILSAMYAEIVKNRETTAFLLANEKPAFSLIDEPLEPLQEIKGSKVRELIIGGLLGGILTGLILFFTKLVGDAMST